jgi:CubicO group peptidase (beta-lactamase class C family)
MHDFAATPDAALAARLDPVIDRALAESRIVGLVTLVARGGALVYRRAAGSADREARRPMQFDGIFRYASLTKPIVSVTALALVESGRLGLDDPVSKWLPEFRPRLPDGREPAILIRHLLTHTSGLSYGLLEPPDGPYHRANVSDGMDQPGLSFDENLRRLASVPLLFEPGTRWNYSLSLDVLGRIIEVAGGASLPAMVERHVTAPLRMRDTGFVVRDPSRLVTPYADATPQPVRMGDPHLLPFAESAISFSPSRALEPRSYPSGGGGMVGTADDYLVFPETLRRGGAPLLRRETVDKMTACAAAESQTLRGPGWCFGLASSVLTDPAAAHTPQGAGTWSWGGVYGSHWFVDPLNETTVVVLTNTAIAGMIGAFPDAVRDAVYGR